MSCTTLEPRLQLDAVVDANQCVHDENLLAEVLDVFRAFKLVLGDRFAGEQLSSDTISRFVYDAPLAISNDIAELEVVGDILRWARRREEE